jgi:hypothetical protein
MASNVPKFASFRPKPKAAEPVVESSKSKTTSSKKKPPEESEHARIAEGPKIQRAPTSSSLFSSDRRGDPDILRYGKLNPLDVPVYRRFGHGRVLGLDPSLVIDREHSTQSTVYMVPAFHHRQERQLSRKRLPNDEGRALRIIPASNNHPSEFDEDFIVFSRKTKKKREGSIDNEKETHDLDHREAERRSSSPIDSDTQYESNTEDFAAQSARTKRNSEFVRRTRESPQDIQAWLDLIEHQEAMIAPGPSATELSETCRLQLADLRIPLYEEALKKFRHDPVIQIKLYQGLLKQAQGSWAEDRLSSKWKEVLALHPSNSKLWLMYLDHVQSDFAQFKYEVCRATFTQCLKALQGSGSDAKAETIMHALLRLTSTIHGSGYQELALAIWQALLEVNSAQPASVALSEAEAKEFEEFWESEAPRIGEPGASGWRKPASSEGLPIPAPLRRPNPLHSVFEDFERRETDSIKKLRYPGRTTDNVGEDDAFHTVFFTDIEEYLNFVPDETPRTLLVEAFLCFCGLPPLPKVAEHQRDWWNDPFLSHGCLQSVLPERPQESKSSTFAGNLELYSTCGQQSMQMTSSLLFKRDFPLHGVKLSADFIRRILRLFATDPSSDEMLGEYLLAFESQHFPSDVVKTAKQLLKARPASQRLYHAYGLSEVRRGNYAKANLIFSTALSMNKLGSYESLMLLSSWVWEALRDGDAAEALWRLASPTGKLPARVNPLSPPDPTTMASTSADIGKLCETALLQHNYASAVIATSLLALLSYLPSNGDADAAVTAHNRLAEYLTSHDLSTSPYAELNAQALVHLLTYHATHAAIVKPASIRAPLEPYISLFPNNTLLLSLYAANEARFTIDDRVRTIMRQSTLANSAATSVAGWSFTLHFERLRTGSTPHVLRAAYKRATHPDASGAHSPAIWAAYLAFEMRQFRLDSERMPNRKTSKEALKRSWEAQFEEAKNRVRDVFYQGVKRVPWCKDFVMRAFGAEEGVFDMQELGRIYGVMGEKELRVYVEIE